MKLSNDALVVLIVGTAFRSKGLRDLLGLWERHELPGAVSTDGKQFVEQIC